MTKKSRSHSSSLRIIGGTWRGRKLSIVDSEGLRPTGDRLRETLFNWLMAEISGARCIDLFAGTGALGLEALSRGAVSVQFIERNLDVYQQLIENLSTLKCTTASTALADALEWLNAPMNGQYDIAFIDPPFHDQLWQPTIDTLENQRILAPSALIYVETPREVTLNLPSTWSIHKQKHAGQICATLYQRSL